LTKLRAEKSQKIRGIILFTPTSVFIYIFLDNLNFVILTNIDGPKH